MKGRIRCAPLVVLAFQLLAAGCANRRSDDFVSLKDGAFVHQGKPFFPVAVNYIVQLQWNASGCWAAPCRNYERSDHLRYTERDSALLQIKAEFTLMRNMGFNTVRVVSLASDLVTVPDAPGLFLRAQYGIGRDSLYSIEGDHAVGYLQAVASVVQLAEEAGLKLIILVRLKVGEQAYEDQLVRLADAFRDKPAVMAYDLFNEPLYFDAHDRPKKDVHAVVGQWQRTIRKHAPHQLTTIGLEGITEVFAWDPAILDVDFLSFHPYEHQPDQVRNEIRWYGENVEKPWIIGETSLPADNDSVPYVDQLAFAQRTLAQVRAYGGIGYSWWQFKDVRWGRFHTDYMGVMNMEGWTDAGKGLPRIEGTVKPVAEAFRNFNPLAPPVERAVLPNYLNLSSRSTARITGRLVDQDREPIAGGVVIGWDEGWSRSYCTISKKDGSFELYGDFRFHHWMASATRYSMTRNDCAPNAFLSQDGVPTYYLGDLRLARLPFAEAGTRVRISGPE